MMLQDKTTALLRQAYFELAKETSPGKITVNAITQKAGIPRSRFYACYPNLDAFCEKLESDILDKIRSILSGQTSASLYHHIGSIGDLFRFGRELRAEIRTIVELSGFPFFEKLYRILAEDLTRFLSPGQDPKSNVFLSLDLTVYLDLFLHTQFSLEDDPYQFAMCFAELIDKTQKLPAVSLPAAEGEDRYQLSGEDYPLKHSASSGKEKLKNAYIKLADTMDQKKISVTALAKAAGVSSVTFYDNFTNLENLRKTLENELILPIAALSEIPELSDRNIYEKTIAAVDYLWEHRHAVWIIRTMPNSFYYEQFHEEIQKLYAESLERCHVFHRRFVLFCLESVLLNITTPIAPYIQYPKKVFQAYLTKLVSILFHL